MATVHVARRTVDRELVAIKRIREDHARSVEFLTMFLDEASIAARLCHPSIVRTLEVGRDGAHAFIVMELLRGHSLWSLWDACRLHGVRLRCDAIAWVGARVAEALHYAHELRDERGVPLEIVHRDVNATNIFVTYDGAIKIIDFGLAKSTHRASRTAAGIIKGKVAYMSPEQAVGATIDRRTDVFALGTTLWELACDRRLFKHVDETETLRRVHAGVVPHPASVVAGFPPALAAILMRALERDKERRYPTCAELARDLDACTRGHSTQLELSLLMRDLFADEEARQAAWTVGGAPPAPPTAPGPSEPPAAEVPLQTTRPAADGPRQTIRTEVERRLPAEPSTSSVPQIPMGTGGLVACALLLAILIACAVSIALVLD
jgi:serine/threonine-protein kinase